MQTNKERKSLSIVEKTLLRLQRIWATIFNIFLTPVINAHILYGGTCHFASDHLILHIGVPPSYPTLVVGGGGGDIRFTKHQGTGGNRPQRGGGKGNYTNATQSPPE